MTGEINVLFDVVNTAAAQVKAGKVRALGVTSTKRGAPLFPNLPAVAETLPDFELVTWHGVMAPRATPRDLILRINRELNAVIARPDVRERLIEAGLEMAGGPPELFEGLLKRDYERYERLLSAAGTKPQ